MGQDIIYMMIDITEVSAAWRNSLTLCSDTPTHGFMMEIVSVYPLSLIHCCNKHHNQNTIASSYSFCYFSKGSQARKSRQDPRDRN